MRYTFTPVRARAYRRLLVLKSSDGDLWFARMPSPGSAQFHAISMNNDFRRARRAGE